MYVYICYETGYEGCSEPLAAFMTEAEATEFCRQHEVRKMAYVNEATGCTFEKILVGAVPA